MDFKTTKQYFMGITIFLFVHAGCRIFYLLNDFIYPAEILYWNIGAILGLLSVVILIAVVETIIFKKSHYIFTIIGIAGLILMTLQMIFNFPINIGYIAQTVIIPILAVVILLIYLRVSIKSTGEIRKSALIMTFGIILFELGQVAHTNTAKAMFWWVDIVGPIIMIVALIFLFISVSRFYSE